MEEVQTKKPFQKGQQPSQSCPARSSQRLSQSSQTLPENGQQPSQNSKPPSRSSQRPSRSSQTPSLNSQPPSPNSHPPPQGSQQPSGNSQSTSQVSQRQPPSSQPPSVISSQPPPYDEIAGDCRIQPPFTNQPGDYQLIGPAQWMPVPHGVTRCPPGLEYLTVIDQLLIHQQVDRVDAPNRYIVNNTVGQQVYSIYEDLDWYQTGVCCDFKRGFIMHITDNTQQEVLRVIRETKSCAGCCWCACSDWCSMEAIVESPVGNVIGFVKQTQSIVAPYLAVMDDSREIVLMIQGPYCIRQDSNGPRDSDFIVLTPNLSNEVGLINQQWQTNFSDDFSVTFARDMDPKIKATLLGGALLIDLMFFEKLKGNPHIRPGRRVANYT